MSAPIGCTAGTSRRYVYSKGECVCGGGAEDPSAGEDGIVGDGWPTSYPMVCRGWQACQLAATLWYALEGNSYMFRMSSHQLSRASIDQGFPPMNLLPSLPGSPPSHAVPGRGIPAGAAEDAGDEGPGGDQSTRAGDSLCRNSDAGERGEGWRSTGWWCSVPSHSCSKNGTRKRVSIVLLGCYRPRT